MTNITNNVLYIGVTSDLPKRVYEHKNKLRKGFSNRYNLCKLVYYEAVYGENDAIAAEKRLKRWHRQWKINLIREANPEFDDLFLG